MIMGQDHMLAAKEEREPAFSNRKFQIKFDGSRAILGNLNEIKKLINRRGTNKIDNYPELKNIELPHRTLLDGEVVHISTPPYKSDFYRLLSRENTKDPFMRKLLMKKTPATFVAFDILMLRGEDLRQLPFTERMEILNKEFNNSVVLKICKTYDSEEEVAAVVKEHGLEGWVIKKADSKYSAGRTDLWIKRKVHTLEWFDVIGYKSMKREVSALLLRKDEKVMGYVNFTKAEMRDTIKSLVTGRTLTDSEKYPYNEIQGLRAYVQHNPANIPALREPVLLKLEETKCVLKE